MSGSYRSALNSGRMPEWESELRKACEMIGAIIARVYDADEDQTDNAMDNGGLAEKLGMAKRLIEEELPADRRAR